MTTKTTLAAGTGLAVAAALASVIAFGSLPDQVPTHWNAAGQVDGWGGKAFGAFGCPAGILLLVLRRSRCRGFAEELQGRAISGGIQLCDACRDRAVRIHPCDRADVRFSPPPDFSKLLIGGMFVFFGLIGNMLGKVKRNFWMGIRCPWTLASDTVWDATHRFAARLVVATSVLGALAVFAGVPIVWPFWCVVGAFCVPVLYAAWLSKRLEG